MVFWYQYHRRTNLWPTYREASLEIDLHYTQIGWQVRKLIEHGWMVKEDRGKQVGLTIDGEKALIDAELIALGKKPKEINIVKNKIKKRNG